MSKLLSKSLAYSLFNELNIGWITAMEDTLDYQLLQVFYGYFVKY